MGDNKDSKYNDPNKKNEDKLNDAVASKPSICGIVAYPGVQYASGVVCTICPSCKNIGPTEVESSWNLKSYLCCYCCGGYWWCFQTYKGKDYIPKDAKHRCSSCKNEISDFHSC